MRAGCSRSTSTARNSARCGSADTQDYGDYGPTAFFSVAGTPLMFHDCVQYGFLSSCLMYSATSTSWSMPPSTRPPTEYLPSSPWNVDGMYFAVFALILPPFCGTPASCG